MVIEVMRRAPLWKRVVAYILDVLVLLFVVLTPLTSSLENQVEGETFLDIWNSLASVSHLYVFTFVLVFLTLLYWSVLEFSFGQTVGKISLGIHVESTNKKPLTFVQALIRNITKLSSLLLFFDVMYLFFKKGDARYFEMLSDTAVVEDVRK